MPVPSLDDASMLQLRIGAVLGQTITWGWVHSEVTCRSAASVIGAPLAWCQC